MGKILNIRRLNTDGANTFSIGIQERTVSARACAYEYRITNDPVYVARSTHFREWGEKLWADQPRSSPQVHKRPSYQEFGCSRSVTRSLLPFTETHKREATDRPEVNLSRTIFLPEKKIRIENTTSRIVTRLTPDLADVQQGTNFWLGGQPPAYCDICFVDE